MRPLSRRWGEKEIIKCFAGKPVTLKVIDPDGTEKEIKAQKGDILRDVLLENEVDVYDWWGKGMNCGGQGACLTCLVDVDSGCGERSDYENKKLKNKPQDTECSLIVLLLRPGDSLVNRC
eukprot:jgi/Bigna1/142264/aug1.68_g16972